MATRLLLGALALLLAEAARAADVQRCAYGAAGDLVGREIYLNRSSLEPAGRRQYLLPVPRLPGCALNGVSARACDVFPPEVQVQVQEQAGAAPASVRVRVRRRGPRLRPLPLDLWLYCDSQPPAPRTAPSAHVPTLL